MAHFTENERWPSDKSLRNAMHSLNSTVAWSLPFACEWNPKVLKLHWQLKSFQVILVKRYHFSVKLLIVLSYLCISKQFFQVPVGCISRLIELISDARNSCIKGFEILVAVAVLNAVGLWKPSLLPASNWFGGFSLARWDWLTHIYLLTLRVNQVVEEPKWHVTAQLLQGAYRYVSNTLASSCWHCLLLKGSAQIVSDLEDSFTEMQAEEQVLLHHLTLQTNDFALDTSIQPHFETVI